jgi:hypothetical protein
MDWGVFPVYAHNPDYDSLDGKVGSGVYVGPLGWFRAQPRRHFAKCFTLNQMAPSPSLLSCFAVGFPSRAQGSKCRGLEQIG